MATQALVDQVVEDLKAIQFKNNPMFREVVAATGDEDDEQLFEDTPYAQVRLEEKSSDVQEAELGERNLIVKVYHRDYDGGSKGETQQSTTGIRANYVQISEYLNDNYSYKAGGVYERAMYLDSISLQSPISEGHYSFEATYKVLLG